MTARQLVLQHLADLSDEDVDALLPIVERLRAKRLMPTIRQEAGSTSTPRRHPERFGALAGSVRFVGDIESVAEPADAWTGDEENLKP